MLQKIKLILGILLISLFINACGSGVGSNPQKSWTIFVYGHADNNLSGSFEDALDRMAKATLGNDIYFIVAADWNASMTKPAGQAGQAGGNYPAGTEWYFVSGGGVKTLLKVEAEEDFDRLATLRSAISYAFTTYPAERYGLILWDHGGAWDYGFGGDSQNGTVASPVSMTMADIVAGITQGLSDASVTAPIDFIGLDTCLLGSVEMAYSLKDLSKVYIGNAEVDFGASWDYTGTFTALGSDPNMTAQTFAETEVATWDAYHTSPAGSTVSDRYLRSHVAIDNSKIEDFALAMKDVVDAIQATKGGGTILPDREQIAYAAASSLPVYGVTASQKTNSAQYRDAGQFLKNLVANVGGDIAIKAQTAIDKLTAMELGKSYGTFRDPVNYDQHALQIALPEISTITDAILADYATKSAAWSNATGWGSFLADLKANIPGTKPSGVQTRTDNTGTFKPTSSSVSVATMELVQNTADTSVNYGAVYFGSVAKDVEYPMTWDGKIWKVGVSLSQPTAVVPWIYRANEMFAPLTDDADTLLGAYGQISETSTKGTITSTGVIIFTPNLTNDQTTATSIAQDSSGVWNISSIEDFVKEHKDAAFKPAMLNYVNGELYFGSNTAEALPANGSVAITKATADGTYFFQTTLDDVWGNSQAFTDTETK